MKSSIKKGASMKVKSKLMVLSTLGLLVSQFSHAGVYPVLRPEACAEGQTIIFPPSANTSVYMSKDCKTAFVLPRDLSKMELAGMLLSPSVNEQDCHIVDNFSKDISAAKEQIAILHQESTGIRKKMAETPPESIGEIEKYKDLIVMIDGLIKGYKKEISEHQNLLPYSKFPGARISIGMTLDMASLLNQFEVLNKGSGLSFKQAQINKGVAHFVANSDPEAPAIILKTTIPGFSPKGKDTFTDDGNTMLNGGMYGEIVLSQPSICQLIKDRQMASGNTEGFNRSILTKENLLDAGFSANYSYEVPVSTEISFDFKAVADAKKIRAAFNGKIGPEGLTQKQISEIIYSGDLNSSIEIKYNDGGLPFTMKEFILANDQSLKANEENIFNVLFGAGMDLYQEVIEHKLVDMAQLRAFNFELAKAPDQLQVNTIKVQDCTWKAKWGRKSERSCKMIDKQEKRFVPGTAIGDISRTDETGVNIHMRVDSEYTLPFMHTTGFGTIKKDK
jgi:hypothetical protein